MAKKTKDTPKTMKAIKEETAREKFVRLANHRVNAVIERIATGGASVGNLSNKQTYEYADADVEAMFTAIRTAVDMAEQRFYGKTDTTRFSL